MKRTLAILLTLAGLLILPGCAWLGMAEPTPTGGILTTTQKSEVYVGPPGSAWTYTLRYVLDDDAYIPEGAWDATNAPGARVRIVIPKTTTNPE